MLQLVDVRDNRVLDEITLVAGVLVYHNKSAQPIVERFRTARADYVKQPVGDSELYRAMEGWSNGYLALRAKAV